MTRDPHLSGAEVVSLLRYTIDRAVHGESCSCQLYPYSSGLRYHVNTTAHASDDMVSKVEVHQGGSWSPIENDTTYSLLGWFADIRLGSDVYADFVNSDIVSETELVATDLFLDFALETKTILAPADDMRSTQSFA